jgi:hypothetical protein
MAVQRKSLPRRFPAGTKFVIEDRVVGGVRGYARYLVFPDGRCVDVPAAGARVAAETGSARRRARPRR